VNAMFELREQIREGLMPEPDYIFCALGTNGTMAGLSLGGILAGLKAQVIGVRVTRDRAGLVPLANERTVRRLMQRTLALLRKHSPDVPEVEIPEQRVLHSFLGAGYGHSTPAGRAAAARAQQAEGLHLDQTYTAKTFAAVQDFISEPRHAGDTVLYWHTYNSVDHSALAAPIDWHGLPRTLHRLFELTEEDSEE
jgi:1-aminocyclopropane-1-carboxylate deaminase/D-cysteine desulfhydrase-like pyridoxal-dependent ACC family enzyme